MAGRSKENIPSSVLQRINQIPSIPTGMLNTTNSIGIYEIIVPDTNGMEELILDANGCFTFGGFVSNSETLSITKIVIDDEEVFCDDIANKKLTSLFASGTDVQDKIAGNTPSFLVKYNIKIYGINDKISRAWSNSSKETKFYCNLIALD